MKNYRVIRVFGTKQYQILMLARYSKMYTVLDHSALYDKEKIVGITIYVKRS
jgi:hypothetical protein